MEHSHKLEPEEAVRSAIQMANLGSAVSVVKVASNSSEDTYRADVVGSRYFIKLFYDESSFGKSLSVLAALAREGFQYAPRMLGHSDPELSLGYRYLVMNDLGSATLLSWRQLEPASSYTVAKEAGRALAMLHSLKIVIEDSAERQTRAELLRRGKRSKTARCSRWGT